ncbi:oncoprotein E7 [Oryctolagus cuniculus papillomavirus 1]|uniref:Protein E7 n=1 Tax=Oryctolagus cuniculus papillomavirus 1 TaxID=2772507 RepID=Q9J030_9PAPI|nr:oncoprotein E7 [Oryctolagus cuniculus papillomavirus 1]AAF67123.1 oncoprotein E7 [Oryctolagus cuniculus papillomavirus 1]
MIGPKPTLQDIVLTETADPVNLHCNERVDDIILEEEDQQGKQVHSAYLIVVECGDCGKRLRFTCVSDKDSIRGFQQLLLGPLLLLCKDCAANV